MPKLIRPNPEHHLHIPPLISEDAIDQMRQRGGKWAAYQNHAMDSRNLGHLRFLKFGEGCTFETPPPKYPDTQYGTGWSYVHVGTVNLESGDIEDGGA